MRLLTWNLNNKASLLEAALRYAAASSPIVVSLQEVPGVLTDSVLLSYGLEKELSILGTLKTQWRSLAIVASRSIVQIGTSRDDRDKMVRATIEFPGYPRLDVIGVHAISKWTAQKELDRQKYARRLRTALNGLWVTPDVVVLGDLNAEPFHPEIWDDEHLFAIRDREMVRHLWGTLKPRSKKKAGLPLFNPAWSMLSETLAPKQPAGSFRYQNLQYSHWLALDYLLLTPGLMDRLQSLKVLAKVNTLELLTSGALHTRVSTGDHLPVLAELAP